MAQVRPVPQPGALVGAPPPQSTSVSVPFVRPSVDVAGSQTRVPALHAVFAQSVVIAQPCPGGQRVTPAVGPPQSMPVSSRFLIPSACVGARHFFWTGSHFALSQSVSAEQPCPVAHLGAAAPPQSLSVSSPFLTPSVGEGAWQTPSLQTLLVQSAPITQTLPVEQAGAFEPPQSTSVSSPFFTPSAGAAL